ncbi:MULTISPECIES: SDR family NAD(P)-dependent oxidoreductase [Thioclava]|uniref:SDR family oxidoreductase n=1 Tax=Thioclava kandeliae TaxID=3070818 RepID=A0ABV1SHK4_9RHOB
MGKKWTIVTGAGSGMGQAFARRFIAAGWGVLAMDLSPEGLAALSPQDGLITAVVDVADRAAVARAIKEAGIGPDLHAAVTAAGIFPPTTLADYTEEKFTKIMSVNVLGTLNVAAEAISVMQSHGTKGAIVTISSADAFTASTGQLVYSASKAAVVSLTRVLAATVAASDITVNGIAPGWVNTPGNAATGRMVGAEKHIPLGRVAQPDEIGQWVWTLASREGAPFVTGETIKVTGGELMS